MSKTIYVVVHVTYDYYRFQDNAGVSTTLAGARKIAKKASEQRFRDGTRSLPIIEDANESCSMNDSECEHIFIEKHKAKD